MGVDPTSGRGWAVRLLVSRTLTTACPGVGRNLWPSRFHSAQGNFPESRQREQLAANWSQHLGDGCTQENGLGQLLLVTSSILQRWLSQLVYNSTGAFALKEPIAPESMATGPWAYLESCLQKDPKYKWGWISRPPFLSLSLAPSPLASL